MAKVRKSKINPSVALGKKYVPEKVFKTKDTVLADETDDDEREKGNYSDERFEFGLPQSCLNRRTVTSQTVSVTIMNSESYKISSMLIIIKHTLIYLIHLTGFGETKGPRQLETCRRWAIQREVQIGETAVEDLRHCIHVRDRGEQKRARRVGLRCSEGVDFKGLPVRCYSRRQLFLAEFT
jgi:hypothetical protein